MTFVAATQQFLAAADWLGSERAPTIVTRWLVAAQLDETLTAPLVDYPREQSFRQQDSDRRGMDTDEADPPLATALSSAGDDWRSVVDLIWLAVFGYILEGWDSSIEIDAVMATLLGAYVAETVREQSVQVF